MTESALAGTHGSPTVYILLPVHNRRDISVAFVQCLQKQSYDAYRLILIDDGSTDGTVDAISEILDGIEIIRGKGDWWWAGSLQKGVEWLKKHNIFGDDVVLIMNDDTQFDADFIRSGLSILNDNPNVLLTATGYDLKTGESRDSGGYILNWENLGFSETYDNDEINCASTRGLMVRVADFLDVGGFHPRLLPHYLSDLEFTMRAQKRGKKLMIHPDFRIGIDFETTGHRELKNETFWEYLRKVFSKRAAMNPLHWCNFILLHSPWKYKARNFLRIWGGVYQDGIRGQLIAKLKRFILRLPNKQRKKLYKLRYWVFSAANGFGLRLRTIAGLSFAISIAIGIATFNLSGTEYAVLRGAAIVDKALPQEFGIPREDAEFLANFRGMIIARVVDDERELKQEIYSEIMRGYRQYGSRLSARQEFATDRERLLAYIMLRVNGSMPIFNPLAAPKELSDILAKKDGNCGPVSTRLLMILDVFGIKARAIRWFSPSLPGHVFVDAYDPLEGKAYLLDSNYNIMSIMEHGEKGFVDSIALMEPEDRKRYFLNEMVSFPFYFSDVNNVKMDDDLFREKEYLKIHDALITALSYEMGAAMVEWKKRYPRGIPYTLSTLAGNDPEVRKFNSQHALPIDGLLLSAGIEADAAVQNNVGNKTAIEGSQ